MKEAKAKMGASAEGKTINEVAKRNFETIIFLKVNIAKNK